MRISATALAFACLILTLKAHPDPGHTLAELDKHLADSPDDAALLKRKAELFLQTGHLPQALPPAARALALSPDDPAILLLQARIDEARGNRDAAARRLAEINRRFPRFAGAWAMLARLHHEAGRIDEAIAAKLRQIENDEHPDPGDFLSAAAWLGERGGPGDTDSAITLLEVGIARFSGLIGLQQKAIEMECSAGRHDSALKRVDTMVAKYRPSSAFSLLRADIFEAAGRPREAAAACDSAIALLGPESAALRETILKRKLANRLKAGADGSG